MMPDDHHGIPAVAPLRREHPNLGPAGEVLDTASYVHATFAMRHVGDVCHDAEPQRCVTDSIISVGVGHAPMIGDRTPKDKGPRAKTSAHRQMISFRGARFGTPPASSQARC
jgi:hypothetical protein